MTLLQCPECTRQFAQTDKLESHLWKVHIDANDGKTNCTVCELPLTKGNYRTHLSCFFDLGGNGLLQHYRSLICPICGRTHNSDTKLRSHIERHDSIEYRAALGDTSGCNRCGKPLTPDNVGEHFQCFLKLEDSHPNTDQQLGCPFNGCDEFFDSVGQGLIHFWIRHFDTENLMSECPGCRQQFSFGEVNQHLACSNNLDDKTASEYISHGKRCLLCNHSSFSGAIVHSHYYLAHLPANDSCPHCNESFDEAGSSELLDHIVCVACWANQYPLTELDDQWPCPACGDVQDSKQAFKNHLLDVHASALRGTPACEHCGESIVDVNQHTDCLVAMGQLPDNNHTKKTLEHQPLQSHPSDDYFDELREFVDRELETAREEAWDRYNRQPVADVLRSQSSIGDLIPVGKQYHPKYDNQIVYQAAEEAERDNPRNIVDKYGIYPGNEVILGSEAVSALPRAAIVTFVDSPSIGFALRQEDGEINDRLIRELTLDDVSYHCTELINPTPLNREREAIDQVQQDQQHRDITLGDTAVSECPVPVPDFAQGSLNTYQKRAVERALGANQFLCIHGPPGTGKTRTLRRLIRLAIARGERVLATAHSNQAIDNLLIGSSTVYSPDEESIHQVAYPAGYERTLPYKLQQKLDDNPEDEELQKQAARLLDRPKEIAVARTGENSTSEVIKKEYMSAEVSDADLVAGTMNKLAELDMSEEFDLIVIDEASQATQPASFIPFLRGKRVVLAGDHLQLPPYAADEQSKEEDMHESLFEHLLNTYGTDISVMLERQYRMNKDIATFPSEQIYDGRLKTGKKNENWVIGDLKPIMAVDINGEEQTDENSYSKQNPAEAELVADHVKLLRMYDVSMDDIGIITPYSAQIETIRTAVRETIGNVHNLKIDTVDSFQGSEREAIIVSFVRSNRGNHSGFLALPEEGKRRLNVALTRGKKRLVLIGDWNTLGTPASYENPDSASNLYAALYSSLNDQGLIKKVTTQGT